MNILITGVNRGIGNALTKICLENGLRVFGTSRNKDSVKDFINHSNFQHLALDMSDENSWTYFLKECQLIPALDIVVNNAGVLLDQQKKFEQLTPEILRQTFEVNIIGAHRVTQALLPRLLESPHAKVVSVTSQMGSVADNSSGRYYAYRSSKSALNMWNKSFSVDFPSVSAIVVHPGWVQTDMGGQQAPLSPENSARGIWSLIEKMSPQMSGHFYDYRGLELPW